MNKKIKWTAPEEDRLEKLVRSISESKTVRAYKLHTRYTFLAEDFVRTMLAMNLKTPEIFESMTLSNGDKIELSETRGNHTLYLHNTSGFDGWVFRKELTESLKKSIEDGHMVHTKKTIQKHHRSVPHTFFYTPERWYVYTNDANADKEKMMCNHLADILLGYSLSFTHKDISANIKRQVRSYIHTGKITLNKPEKIDPVIENVPGAMIFLSDTADCLVWKFSQFCTDCGKIDPTCYCIPVDSGENWKEMVLSERCWGCTQKLIDASLTQNYGNWDKKLCDRARDDYMCGFVENASELYNVPGEEEYRKWFDYKHDGNCLEVTWKKIDEKGLKELWDMVFDEYSNYDYEPGENTCTCPTWG